MARGPARTPTKILKMRGSKRAGRNHAEPEPEPGIPDPPIPLTGEALKMWHHIIGITEDLGILTAGDGVTLARYCKIWIKWMACEELIDKKGMTYEVKTKVGGKMIRQSPHAQMAMKLSDQLLRIEQEYGLTPASRSSVRALGGRRNKGKARFFKQSKADTG